jgi:broad specificity phosphatase PhoE
MKHPRSLVLLALAANLLLGGCGHNHRHPEGQADAAAVSAPASTGKTILLVRHAEKQDLSDDPNLSADGRQRAHRLLQAVRDAGVDTVYTSDKRRTQQTAAEVLSGLNIKPGNQRHFRHDDDPAALANTIRADPGRVILVVAHSHMLPGLLKALGPWTEPAVAEQDYDNFFVITLDRDGANHLIRTGYPPRKTP